MLTFVKGKDIALSSADAIVNASNGIGYMGGKRVLLLVEMVLLKAYIT